MTKQILYYMWLGLMQNSGKMFPVIEGFKGIGERIMDKARKMRIEYLTCNS